MTNTDHNFYTDELIAIEPANSKYVGITWQVTDFCNYSCSYCNPGNYEGKHKNIANFDKIVQNLTKITNHYRSQGYEAFKFYFSGGEPTVWKHLIPLIEWLKNQLDEPQIGINTNLSRSTKWWTQNHHLFHDVVASFHIEYVDKERYLKNLTYLQDKVNYLCSRMMMEEKHFQEVIDYGTMLKSKLLNYNLEWVPLWDDIRTDVGPWEYSEQWMKDFFEKSSFERQEKVQKPRGTKWRMSSNEIYKSGACRSLNGNRIVSDRKNYFMGWQCNVGESLFINARGQISAASCGQGPELGNIYRDIKINSGTIICNKTQCTCGTDIYITKHKAPHHNIIATENSHG